MGTFRPFYLATIYKYKRFVSLKQALFWHFTIVTPKIIWSAQKTHCWTCIYRV